MCRRILGQVKLLWPTEFAGSSPCARRMAQLALCWGPGDVVSLATLLRPSRQCLKSALGVPFEGSFGTLSSLCSHSEIRATCRRLGHASHSDLFKRCLHSTSLSDFPFFLLLGYVAVSTPALSVIIFSEGLLGVSLFFLPRS